MLIGLFFALAQSARAADSSSLSWVRLYGAESCIAAPALAQAILLRRRLPPLRSGLGRGPLRLLRRPRPRPGLLSPSPPLPSFEAVFAECAPLVWRTMRRLGAREADAEDLSQEVFLVVHRKLPTFEGRSKLTTWVYGICVRVAADHRKRAHVRREAPSASPPDAGVDPAQAGAIELAEARAFLDTVLAALDDDKRAVFVLYEIEELPMAEVALAIGVPLQTAYSRLHAARRFVNDAATRHSLGQP